jgi:uncharacterized membrane protein
MSDVPTSEKPPAAPREINLSLRWLRDKLLAGLFVIVPVVVTYWILNFLYRVVSSLTEPAVTQFVRLFRDSIPNLLVMTGRHGVETIPGAALVMTLLVVVVVGLLVTNVFGRRILHWLEGLLQRIPLVNVIYPVAKQVVEALKVMGEAEGAGADPKPVVYLKYPGMSGYLLGFQTGRFRDSGGVMRVTVFLPTVPNPITGFVLVFDERDVVLSDLTYDEALKMVVSGGLVVPGHLRAPGGTARALPATGAAEVPGPADTTRKG